MYDKTYQEVIEYFNDNFAYWCTHILNLGKPEYTNSVDTAAVALTSDDADKFTNFSFLFNKDFLDGFPNVDQKSFIFAHECMHIILNHLNQANTYADFKKIKRLAEKADREGLTNDEMAAMMTEQKKMQAFNIAADCVINDYLSNEGFECPTKNGGAPLDVFRGESTVGHDCAQYTVREVYNELMQNAMGQDSINVPGGSVDSHDWMFEQSKKEIEAAEKLFKELQANGELPADANEMKNKTGGKQYSLTAQDVQQTFIDTHGTTMDWLKLLQEINPDVFRMIGEGPPKKPSFHKKRRKLGGFPNVNLPVKRVDPRTIGETDKVPAMVIALDTSGSISQQDRNKFVTLARSVPQNRIKLFPITFTTSYKHLNLDNPSYNSGGTCFSCIQDYILKDVVPVLGHYPKAVCVVTDGYADFSNGNMPDEQMFKSWYWLVTANGDLSYINQWGKQKNKKIDDFVRR